MKRIVCIWLALLLAAGSLWSCGGTETAETEAAAETSGQTTETEVQLMTPAVEDFGGATFTILPPSERYMTLRIRQAF